MMHQLDRLMTDQVADGSPAAQFSQLNSDMSSSYLQDLGFSQRHTVF
jgi:hypothetical protein